MSEKFISEAVSKAAINHFFKNNLRDNNDIFTLEIYENNELIVRYAPDPYNCGDKAEVYSFSKSFTSTAVGLVIEAGLLSIEDKIVDLFPDKCPKIISKNLGEMKIKHLLSMNTGHPQCVLSKIIECDDMIKEFLALEVPYTPGTHFAYNSAASFILSSIVTKLTGLSVFDWLSLKIFRKMDISEVSWCRYNTAASQGGTGICISTDDMAKLALLYLNKGRWNGEQLLSREWVESASSIHSDNSQNGSPDWCSGYGFQFWINAREGFRADGAYGQLGIICPEKKIAVVVKAETTDMQREVDHVFELIYSLHAKDDETEKLFDTYPVLDFCESNVSFLGERFICAKNPMEITWLGFDKSGDDLALRFSNGKQEQIILAGNERWLTSEFYAKEMKPKLIDIMYTNEIEKIKLAACYKMKKNKITILCRHLNTPHSEEITAQLVDGNLEISFRTKHLLKDGSKNLLAAPVKF